MKDLFVSTIWHTGSHSVVEMLKEEDPGRRVVLHHCNKTAEAIARGGEHEVITTFRDPYRIAASWINRDRLKTYPREWHTQWDHWSRIAPLAKIYRTDSLTKKLNTHKDTYQLHAALDRGDLETFHQRVPIAYIDYAKRIVNIVNDSLIYGDNHERETYPR